MTIWPGCFMVVASQLVLSHIWGENPWGWKTKDQPDYNGNDFSYAGHLLRVSMLMGGTPIAEWFTRKIPHFSMDDNWGYPGFRKPPEKRSPASCYRSTPVPGILHGKGRRVKWSRGSSQHLLGVWANDSNLTTRWPEVLVNENHT